MTTATAELGNHVLIELGVDELIVRQGQRVSRLDLESPAQAIELKVGGSSIKIDSAGITIKGLNVKIEGELTTQVTGGIQAGLRSDGVTAIKGGLTTIDCHG